MAWTGLDHPHRWPALLHEIVYTGLITAAMMLVLYGSAMDLGSREGALRGCSPAKLCAGDVPIVLDAHSESAMCQ